MVAFTITPSRAAARLNSGVSAHILGACSRASEPTGVRVGPRELLSLRLAAGFGHNSIEPCATMKESSRAGTSATRHVRARRQKIIALTIRSSRARFAASCKCYTFSPAQGRKSVRLNSGVSSLQGFHRMPNPFNPLDWLSTAQEWFSKTEKSSGFRPFLIYMILSMCSGFFLLVFFSDQPVIQALASLAIGIPILSFVPLFMWKAHKDPDFCRSETHIQKVKKIEMEMMGSDSKPITADVLEQRSLSSSIKEPLLIEGESTPGGRK